MTEPGLHGDQVRELFPFLVAFDEALRVVAVGPSLASACPTVVPGRPMSDCFRILRPNVPASLERLRASQQAIVVAEEVASGLRLRGQVVFVESPPTILFLASPWIQDPSELERFGLSIDNFAAHDPTTDYVFLLQGKNVALQEARVLSQRLQQQRTELRNTIDALTEAAVQHQRARAALESSEANLRAILDSAADGIVTIDDRGTISTFNAAASRIFGWSPQETIGRNVSILAPPPHRDEHDAYLARYLSAGEPRIIGFGREVEGVRKDGSRFPLHLSVSEVATGEGRTFTGILRDLTGLKEAQQARAESEARTRMIVDTALDAVITIDVDGVVTTWNRQAEAAFGWRQEEAIGRQLSELIIPPGLREAHRQGMQHYLATGDGPVLNRRIEVPAQDRNGREFPVELAISPLRLGNQISFSAFVRDISQRKRAEQLGESLHRITRLFAESSSLQQVTTPFLEAACSLLDWDLGAFWMMDNDAGQLRSVDVWCRPGLNPAEFLEETRTLRFAPGIGLPGRVFATGQMALIPNVQASDNFPRARTASAGSLRSGVALPIPQGQRTAGVIEFFSRKTAEPDADALQTLTNLASQLGQFIERRHADEALARSESHTRAVIDHMLEGLVVVGPDLKVVTANAAFAQIFGYDQGDLVGMPATQLLPPTEEYQEPSLLREVYRQSLGRVTEREGRRKSGEIFPLEVQVYRVPSGEDELTVCHVRDLSQQRYADRLKKQFVATVSHELRTPLTSIRGSLGLLATGAVGQLPADALRIVEMAERNTVRLVGLINDILDFERIESGRLSLSCARFPVQRAIERAIESVAPLARQSDITIELPPTPPLEVYADEARIVQVLVNLLSNAIKFSPNGSQVDVSVTQAEKIAEVRVRDRGRGIPDTLREIVFEPFRQAEVTDARRSSGSGLGLSICRAIVRQHGGDIGVEPPEGPGTVLWFTLPVPDETMDETGTR